MHLGTILFVSCATALLVQSGCDDLERECYPGDFVACECDDGKDGYAQCDAEGTAYGACGYCGTTPGAPGSEGGGGAGGGEGGGELLPFMSACEQDEQCSTGLCFNFAAKGPHCSHPCESAADCEPPSTGCNGMGVCKAP